MSALGAAVRTGGSFSPVGAEGCRLLGQEEGQVMPWVWAWYLNLKPNKGIQMD